MDSNNQDSAAPNLVSVPVSTTITCEQFPAYNVSNVSAVDLCDPQPGVSVDTLVQPGRCPFQFTQTRTWTTADRCGNTASATQIINVDVSVKSQLA